LVNQALQCASQDDFDDWFDHDEEVADRQVALWRTALVDILGESIRRSNWERGACLLDESVRSLLKEKLDKDSILHDEAFLANVASSRVLAKTLGNRSGVGGSGGIGGSDAARVTGRGGGRGAPAHGRGRSRGARGGASRSRRSDSASPARARSRSPAAAGLEDHARGERRERDQGERTRSSNSYGYNNTNTNNTNNTNTQSSAGFDNNNNTTYGGDRGTQQRFQPHSFMGAASRGKGGTPHGGRR
jgi:hypothetical protein